MKKDKIFFLIPGFKEQASDEQYQWLIKHIQKAGWKVVKVPVEWNRTTLSKNARVFEVFFNTHKGRENRVLGFSYGAVITLLTANKLQPDKIYLCSLSPDFREDVDSMPVWLKKYIGKKRLLDVETRSGIVIAKQLSIPSVVFYGEEEGCEYPSLKKRCEEISLYAKNSRLVAVENAPHKIDHPQYIKALKNELDL
ncbi:MAG: hypothetical protein KBC35_03625 [Candidatus Pacebacteria bacterium]|nr:hypothetical protein [Candidatus Paceibacterota bacterium]